MTEPVAVHRQEVTQRIQIASTGGGWEGAHTDFKTELGTKTRDLEGLLKHLLAFANTPRRTDAYIIYGVHENKDERIFEHVGVSKEGFPTPERLDQLIHQHTNLHDVFVDAYFTSDGKRTPYIAIPFQYEGPQRLTRPLRGGPGALSADEVFRRNGSSSVRATERDVRRMTSDWGTWFLDCRYAQNASALREMLARHFPNRTTIEDKANFVRLIYQSAITDDFGRHEGIGLLHAYWGFDPVPPSAVERILQDAVQAAFQRIIIGARFQPETETTAARSAVRCIPLDEIYFVNDPYATLCREFLREWEQERDSKSLSFIMDLDFMPSGFGVSSKLGRQTSILSFLDQQLKAAEHIAIVVHGGFGCGKTTTAKQFVAELSEEYLRGNTELAKVFYIDVNNIDIRARRDECIESQLARYRLSREQVDQLIAAIRTNQVHFVFDGVDEMARPYTASGRHDAIELLKDIGNRSAGVYFVRSSYYPHLNEMLSDFSILADHDLQREQPQMVVAEIRELRQEQVNSFLESRLGAEDAHIVRGTLHRLGLQSFLGDPLIISLVAELIDENGVKTIESYPTAGKKAHFLMYLVEQLLKREQAKRQRHGGLAANFIQFQRILRAAAFDMVWRGSDSITSTQLEAIVSRVLDSKSRTEGDLDAFRTMSWIHRSDDDGLTFRHEALTLVCAAEHVCGALQRRDVFAVSDWQDTAALADVVCEYAGETISSEGILGAAAMLGSEPQINVRQLVMSVLRAAKGRQDLKLDAEGELDERFIAAVCRGILSEPSLALLPIRTLFGVVTERRRMQITIPLLWYLGRGDSTDGMDTVVELLAPRVKREWNFCDELREAKKDQSSSLDMMLLRDLDVNASEVLDAVHYERLFKAIYAHPAIEKQIKQFADRTLRAIEGERHRRESMFKQGQAGR
jgi:hypothetical protein